MAQEDKICKYIDMPLQHISDHILKEQNRNITTQQTKDLIGKIRKKMPQASLRTTFIVGLPGETEEDFKELVNFVRETRFEKVGAFIYSKEEGTESFAMPNHVPATIKKKRLNQLMKVQREISKSIQESYIGRTLNVLIEEKQANAQSVYLGRSEHDAPDVDGLVFVNSGKTLKQGDIVPVRITDSYEYDLSGQAVDSRS